jgi:hypothetical protein
MYHTQNIWQACNPCILNPLYKQKGQVLVFVLVLGSEITRRVRITQLQSK